APDGRKVKGTLHWVAAHGALPAELRIYDRLFSEPTPGARTGDPLDDLNPESLVVKRGFIEPSVAAHPAGTRYQFERTGYFVSDTTDSKPGALVFNRIVTLRDTWAKLQDKAADAADALPGEATEPSAAPKAQKARPAKRTKAQIRTHNRAADPALEARFQAYQAALGLDEDTADLLAGEADMADLFDAARASYAGDVAGLAKWFVNDLSGALGDRAPAELPTDGAALARVLTLVDEGTVTSRASKDLLEVLLRDGGDPDGLVAALGLEAVADTNALADAIAGVLAKHGAMVERFRGGEQKLFGFFIGQVMQATGGAADPKAVRDLLTAALKG
ncbi:MAG: glutamine--tRNA ligase, partial [Myxococcales bacterium]|nr:glutamine--tRNA ligase [Myxococcales bacterium]